MIGFNKFLLLDRFFSFIVDIIFLYIFSYIISNIYFYTNKIFQLSFLNQTFFTSYLFFIFIFLFIVPTFYFAYSHSKRGQTFGMYVFNLRIHDNNGENLKFFRALLRSIFFFLTYLSSFIILVIINFSLNKNFEYSKQLDTFFSFFIIFNPILLLSLIMCLFNKNKQSLYDYIFGVLYSSNEKQEIYELKESSGLIYTSESKNHKFLKFLSFLIDTCFILFLVFIDNYFFNVLLNTEADVFFNSQNTELINFLLIITLLPIFYYFYSLKKFQQTFGMYILKFTDRNSSIERLIVNGVVVTYIIFILIEIIILFKI